MKRPRHLTSWLVFVGAVAAGVWFFGFRGRGDAESGDAKAYQTATVDRGRITAKVTATGTLSAVVTVQVGAQVSGRLQEIRVDFNSEVKKGQVLARLDPQFFGAALEQARANAVAAQGNLKKARVQAAEAERQLDRTRTLAAKQFVAQADLDAAVSNAEIMRATAEAAEGGVAQARAALRSAEVNLGYTTIVSPIDGIVISRNVDVGQTVAASFQAPVLFVLAEDLSKMQVDTSVAEADVGKLLPKMTATFTVDAFPGERFHGIVRQIRNAAQTVQNVVTYDAVLDVANPEAKLKPGMTANVTFITGEKLEALRIPNAALRFRPPPSMFEGPGAPASVPPPPADSGRRTLWVLRDATPVAVTIRPGLTDGVMTESAEGDIQAGDTVITDAPSQEPGRRRGLRLF